MRRIKHLLLVLMLAVALIGCGEKEDSPKPTKKPTESNPTVTKKPDSDENQTFSTPAPTDTEEFDEPNVDWSKTFIYEIVDESYALIKKYADGVTEEELVIPGKIEGYPVVIEKEAFKEDKKLKKLILSEGVIEIKNSAFDECKSLTEVTFPKSLKKIGFWAFNSTAITHLDLQEGLEYLNGFSGLLLDGIKIPSTVTTVAGLDRCGLTEIIIPEGVEEIYRIGENPFKEIHLPDSVKTIGYMAFAECNDLEKINAPKSLEEIGEEAFYKCNKLEEFTIPSGVKSIGKRAFSGCSFAKKVILPDTLEELGTNAFSSCPYLTEIYVPGSVKTFYLSVIDYCPNYVGVALGEGVEKIKVGDSPTKIKYLALPNSISNIFDYFDLTSTYYLSPTHEMYANAKAYVEKYAGEGAPVRIFSCNSTADLPVYSYESTLPDLITFLDDKPEIYGGTLISKLMKVYVNKEDIEHYYNPKVYRNEPVMGIIIGQAYLTAEGFKMVNDITSKEYLIRNEYSDIRVFCPLNSGEDQWTIRFKGIEWGTMIFHENRTMKILGLACGMTLEEALDSLSAQGIDTNYIKVRVRTVDQDETRYFIKADADHYISLGILNQTAQIAYIDYSKTTEEAVLEYKALMEED